MKSTQYSEKVLDHFRNPRNVGTLEGADVYIGRVGNPVCGDLMEFYLKITDNKIEDIRFKTFGCGSAIATASMITELAKGMTVDDAMQITRQDVADELNGLPPIKMHCSNLAADALKDAINNYRQKQKPAPAEQRTPHGRREITGVEKFKDHGIHEKTGDLSNFKDRRVMVLDRGERSMELAIRLTKLTPRVVFVTSDKKLQPGGLRDKLVESSVRILYESELMEIRGLNTVEKVLMHDMNEDEKYELFVDDVIMLK
jgi:FeS cluster assembly scaffold protein NifU